MDENNIKWFKQISTNDITEIGYKAARLAELYNARFQIPRGFIINSKYYFSFIQENNIKEKSSNKTGND
jgi:phosphoenolpyruvate synthase/pyruvate phosphate dikinase